MSACCDRKVLKNETDLKVAFKILDTNKDGTISLDDFDDLFNSYGGAKMDNDVWENLLAEADQNDDGIISYPEFKAAMGNMLRKDLGLKTYKGNSINDSQMSKNSRRRREDRRK